ncbi:MAG: cytochrome c biogenesis protein CcsA [Chromatiales bacterium]|nr:cytochrome c biogenesis protein CcsA [Chromatiales bacterium]
MMGSEAIWAIVGSGFYALGTGLAFKTDSPWVGRMVLNGAIFVALAIGLRWHAVGHGPFLTLYEILLSSLFSLGLIYGIAHLLSPAVRSACPTVCGVLLLLGVWLLIAEPRPTPLPATYENPWLWLHVLVGKLFLGCSLIAAGLALAAAAATGEERGRRDEAAWQWLLAALVFHSAMLVAGAVWAQDAWGRYWAWDPLETWAFGTWLFMVAVLHARRSVPLSARLGRLLIVAVFVLAFLTFFGVPFVSLAPHKGAV